MPSPTYTLIQSTTLSTNAATVTFSSIPTTFSDLVFRITGRSTVPSGTYDTGYLYNGTAFSSTKIQGINTTISSSRTTGTDAQGGGIWVPNATTAANIFGSTEVYWPNYQSTVSQPVYIYSVAEQNATNAPILLTALLWQSTSALSSVLVFAGAGSFVAGSTLSLYGIKNT